MSIRIVIGEDQALLRQGIVRLLGDAGFEVVAEAADAPDLLRKVAAHKPDVAIVDVQMPPDNTDDGLRAAMQIRAHHPDVGVLVLSQYAEERYAVDLIGDNAEGVGYLLKDRVTDFTRLRRGRAAGRQRRIRARSRPSSRTCSAAGAATIRWTALTPREREVLELMAEGRSNKGIAEKLVVTPHAVEKHVTSIFTKLGVATGAEDHRRVLAVLHFVRGESAPLIERCPRPRRAVTSSVPSSAPTRSLEPAQPAPPAASAPPTPSSRMSTIAWPFSRRTVDARRSVASRVLGDVGQRLGDDEVGRGLDRRSGGAARARRRARPGRARGWRATRARRRGRAG